MRNKVRKDTQESVDGVVSGHRAAQVQSRDFTALGNGRLSHKDRAEMEPRSVSCL